MDPCDTSRCSELAQAVGDLFARGLDLGEDAGHYLESVAGCADPTELPAILADEAHPEHRSLLELVYFPDMAARLELEPVLRRHAFIGEDLPKIAEQALRIAPFTRVLSESGPVEIQTPHAGAELFLSRLHPLRVRDPEIAGLLEERLSCRPAMRCLVHLRACRETLSSPARRLLSDFVKAMAEESDFEDGLLHLLRLAPLVSEESDEVAALLSRRFQLENALDRALRQERDLRSHAVETLLTQRASLLSIDKEAVHAEMDWLDRVLVRIYHVMPASKSGPEIAVDREDTPENSTRLVDFFSPFDG